MQHKISILWGNACVCVSVHVFGGQRERGGRGEGGEGGGRREGGERGEGEREGGSKCGIVWFRACVGNSKHI